jgi:FAD:protein FMN transferase
MSFWYNIFLFLISVKAYSIPDMPSLKTFVLTGKAQGTTFNIKYRSADSLVNLFVKVDQSLSLYNTGSLISTFNHSDEVINCDEYMLAVVKKSLEICLASDGAFDITVKPLVDLWGFGTSGKRRVPSGEKIRKALSGVGCSQIYVAGNRLYKKNKTIQIDCNGIAQGYTVDLISVLLESKGVKNYMVELGGEIRVLGLNNEEQEWSIGIEGPLKNMAGDYEQNRVLRLSNGAVTTSGTYRNAFSKAGKQYSHLINPHTGYPIENGMLSATVIAPDAITADALDNVCMVLGPEAAIKLLQKYPNVEAYLVYQLPNGQMADTLTRGFKKYLIDGE